MMKNSGGYIILFLPLIFFASFNIEARESREEAIFGLVYQKYSSDFIVYIQNDSIYLPFEEVLSYFKIYYISKENKRFEGYVNNADSSFVVDFKLKEIRDIEGIISQLNDDLWFATDFQVFIRTDLLEDLFKLKFRTLFNSLSITVQSDYELPFLRAIRTEQRINLFETNSKDEFNFPVISDRTFTILNGGILDYTIGTSQSTNYQSYNFNLNTGLELFSGEFQYNIFGRFYSDEFDYQDRFRWRYLVESDWVQSISLGNIQNMAYRNSSGKGFRKPYYSLKGIQITNETSKLPNAFTDYVIEDIIEPDWTVELYLADQLYEIKKADINGYYRFEIPITYGLTNIKVKLYGERGEFITEEKVLNIPSQLLVPGELRYSIAAGQDENSGLKIADASINMGVFSWLTTSISAIKEELSDDVYLINQAAVNIYNNTLLNLTATNRGIFEAGIKLPSNSLGNFEISYTHFEPNSDYNHKKNSINLIASFNRVFSLPFSLSVNGSREAFLNFNTSNIYSNLNFYMGGMNFSIRHNLTIRDVAMKISNSTQNLSISATYSFGNVAKLLSVLRRLNLNFSTYVNPDNWEINSISAGSQLQLEKNIAINANYIYYTYNKLSNLKIGINMNLAALRSNSNADFNQGRDAVYSTDLSGSVEFDSQNLRLSFLNSMGSSSIYGKSSAAIRFYNDVNYNNTFDNEDELIPEGDFSVLGSLVHKSNVGKYKILSNLIPNSKYNIRVNTESFSNPATIPQLTEFSFIASPYSYKSIDIACHISGFVEGSVSKKTESGNQGFGGMRVNIKSKDSSYSTSVLVFSDGSYFFNGIPVGDYIAQLDSNQLKILNSISVPSEIEFSIKPSKDGDYVGNISFAIISDVAPSQDDKDDFEFISSDDEIGGLATSRHTQIIKKMTEMKDSTNVGEKNSTTEKTINAGTVIDEPKYDIGHGKISPLIFNKSRITFLDKEMKLYLDKIAVHMKANPKLILKIEGHSDNSGTMQENLDVSLKRAAEVVSYLYNKGIDRSRLLSSGRGPLYPIADSKSEKKLNNNRVELTLSYE